MPTVGVYDPRNNVTNEGLIDPHMDLDNMGEMNKHEDEEKLDYDKIMHENF